MSEISKLPRLFYDQADSIIIAESDDDDFGEIDCLNCMSHSLAEQLVQAANAFPGLVEALKEAKKLFELGITHANGGGRGDGMPPFIEAENIHAIINQALQSAGVKT